MDSIAHLVSDFKTQFPALNGRVERAAHLVNTSGVIRLSVNEWQVASNSGGQPHRVTFQLFWSCDCKDFDGSGYHPAPRLEFCGATGPICQHIVAAAMTWLLDYKPSPKTEAARTPEWAFDLVVATKRQPFVSQADGEIVWTKKANEERKDWTGKGLQLTSAPVQKALNGYKLVNTECTPTATIRRYSLIMASEVQL